MSWVAYERYREAEQYHVGKENTPQIESKHLNLRSWIKWFVRHTTCFSKTARMHDLVIELCMNRYACARALHLESTPWRHR
jgi:IS1 family transposase